jgi:antitoxin (DNA-binding transcriptional repressor) of toxin-antitoxin stability system
MLAVTATEFARNLSQMLDQVEHKGVTISIVRNQTPVATLSPQLRQQSAADAFGDLYRPLEHTVLDDWMADVQSVNASLHGELGGQLRGAEQDPWQ